MLAVLECHQGLPRLRSRSKVRVGGHPDTERPPVTLGPAALWDSLAGLAGVAEPSRIVRAGRPA
jgi:hypothetical protein